MRRIFVFLLLSALALAGCSPLSPMTIVRGFKNTTVPYSRIENYMRTEKFHPIRVGENDIKFYVVVNDKRKKKFFGQKTYIVFHTGVGRFENFKKTFKTLTEKALRADGWGVADNLTDADFVIVENFKDASIHRGFVSGGYIVLLDLYMNNPASGETVLSRTLKAKKWFYNGIGDIEAMAHEDGTGWFAAVRICNLFYRLMLKFFASKPFLSAISGGAA